MWEVIDPETFHRSDWWGKAEPDTPTHTRRKGHTMTNDDESRKNYAIARQAAIDSIRAFVAEPYKRYVDAYNGYDRANDLELVDCRGKLDMAAISDIRMEIVRTFAEAGITLVGGEEEEVVADWDIHDNSDGSGERVRMICEPAILWESPAYGWIVVQKAYTIAV